MASSSTFRRDDGRSTTAMRQLGIELGGLSKSDGSARFGFGAEQVIAAFHGPSEADRRDELIDRAALRITHRPLESIPGVSSKALASNLESLYLPLLNVHAYPKSTFHLTLQSNTSGSSSLNHTSMSARAASINAATLAILDVGSVDASGVALACSIAVVPTNPKSRSYDFSASYVTLDPMHVDGMAGDDDEEEDAEVTMILDPTWEEEKMAVSKFAIAWAFGNGLSYESGKGDNAQAECVYLESEGSFDDLQFQKAFTASKAACAQILAEIRQKVSESR